MNDLQKAQHLAAQRRFNEKARAAGLCEICRKVPRRPSRVTCAKCAADMSDDKRNRYARLMAAGLCTSCGGKPQATGTILCADCRVAKKAIHARFRAKKRERVIRDGVCTSCGSADRRPDYFYCSECLTKRKVGRYAKFGFTREHLEALGDSCHVCGSTRDLHIDHGHVSGVVRGLLCQLCNNGLGMFRDSPDLLLKASQYLMEATKKKPVVATEEFVH